MTKHYSAKLKPILFFYELSFKTKLGIKARYNVYKSKTKTHVKI